MALERKTGLEPATTCLEGRNSSQLSYFRIEVPPRIQSLYGTKAKTFRPPTYVVGWTRCP